MNLIVENDYLLGIQLIVNLSYVRITHLLRKYNLFRHFLLSSLSILIYNITNISSRPTANSLSCIGFYSEGEFNKIYIKSGQLVFLVYKYILSICYLFIQNSIIMGSLFVQVGQCGCQIGVPLNQKLSSSYYCTRIRPPNRLHAIMVDTEPKVIKQIVSQNPKWLDPSNVKSFQFGRGNNWSYGYLHELPQKPLHLQKMPKGRQFSHIEVSTLQKYIKQNKEIAEFVIEKIRRELETVDCAMAINLVSSLGGGTGSGLGTKLVQCIHDEINLNIYSHVVLPNKSGQSPLQVYNCLLSLQSHIEHCSAIFTYQNDKMITYFQNIQERQANIDSINQHLANKIAKLVKINEIPNYDRFYSDIVSQCVLSPELKFLNLYATESKKGSEDDALARMLQQIKNYHTDIYGEQFVIKEKREKLLHGQLLISGCQKNDFQQKYGKKYRNVLNPFFQDSLTVQSLLKKGKQESSEAVFVSNHSSIGHYLGYLASSGRKKYQAGAYLWHYQYADIQQALNSVDNVIEQYHYFTHG